MSSDWEHGGFGIYVHWPFCEAKCPYCDFNSHVVREIDQLRWLRAYLLEIERYGRALGGRVVSSIFFGGGTPSLMNPDVVAGVIEKIKATWPVANDLEVTLEANPGSVEAGRFRAYQQAGVSRISMGVQALNDADLRRLGRIHTVKEAQAAFQIARDTFENVSFDLIYARQGQTPAAWRAELTEALALAVDHLSLYQLTIEQGTAFGDRYNAGKLRDLPDDDDAAEMYEITQEVCGAAGLSAYEVSNHARVGAECRHNLVYWRYGDYVGIGPGAHGRVTLAGARSATEAYRQPNAWLDAAERGSGDKLREGLTHGDEATELLLMGLRLSEGVSLGRYEALAKRALKPAALAELLELGMVTQTGDRLVATQRGRFVLNSVLSKLLED
ncbi:radical SAM family heme chaperone HemW [uncultured Lentibacter sp.]|uniref:radical SAM family heme chaperone HemW n=1 Tax=uncultured Lentibacter sp. TaxID=1659309 RepID=UPI00261CC6A7|nr:radical SAM family heme chaperone HemW [uncultured Lentibacter sp.]